MSGREPVELSWTVNGLKLCGLSWGSPGQAPLLMLHGWLDNAASFSMLAPLLVNYHVVALDLTGQGQSDRRSADATYQIWDDLPEVLGVLEQLGWSSFNLLGHSRGAIIAALLASAVPERIEHLVLLDAIYPEAVPEAEFPAQLRKFLDQKPTLLATQNRVFGSVDEAAAQREKSGLTPGAARLLAQRSLKTCEQGFTWTTDRRLYGASAVKITEGQNRAVLQGLTMPSLLLLAEGGRMASSEVFKATLRYSPSLGVEYVAGGHHFHMEEPLAALTARIDSFLQEERE
jgi:pimeloyl-ACP methyl ester carboxylesterase